ncbi:MAG TPA: Wzz/FepE/Etk N-terminal domain-containing protein [Thermoanaerobaculia bacterium]|jgi:uncharacterized protein involved in exopolysaccharide biosynthesis|nr:Wzz/FepE/Etk N-terminal domain-containing protein [Thermoanaerobaculia bacterium]
MSLERLEDAEAPRPVSRLPETRPVDRLRRQAFLVAAFACGGALLAFGASRFLPRRYRATATLLVAEPRLGGPGQVDYNLTPVRSYTALLSSRSLAEACVTALGAAASRDGGRGVAVRVPENTRLLEVSFDGSEAASAASFANCVAERAVAENRRMNAALSKRTVDEVTASLTPVRERAATLDAEIAARRASTLLEVKRGELRSALDELGAYDADGRRARLAAAEALARKTSFGAAPANGRSTSAGEFAEQEAASASAAEAAANAAARESRAGRAVARDRAARLEGEIARAESELEDLKRRRDAAAAAAADLSRRGSLAGVESAAKEFELVLVAPASPPSAPTNPRGLVVALSGALAAAAVAALFVLSRPD